VLACSKRQAGLPDARAMVEGSAHQPSNDLARLFAGGVGREGAATVRVNKVADLHLGSGRILAGDPLTGSGSVLAQQVSPGDYPVEIAVARSPGGQDERVAAARIRFRHGVVVTWELAVPAGKSLADLPEEDTYGYGVDTGMGSFMDAEVASAQNADREAAYRQYERVIEPALKAHERTTWTWMDYHPAPDRSDNIVMFSTGDGDGFYSSYWGRDQAGVTLQLVTEFLRVW